MTKIVFISDTHTKHRQLSMPEGDILIHCGDFTYTGDLIEIASFNNWLGELNYQYKLVVAGNHELQFDTISTTRKRALLSNATYLEDEKYEINGLNFWFSPWTSWFYNWAFNFSKDPSAYEKQTKIIWGKIPDNTNILVTHGPAYGVLDKLEKPRENEDPHVGCKYLLKRINELKELKIHAFGHIHGAVGVLELPNYTAINASNLNEQYKVTNKPIVIEL